MGVPQRRKRVFFIARRNDLNLPKLVLNFREKPIYFGEVRSPHGIPLKECMMASLIKRRKPGDKCFSDISKRVRGKRSMFTDRIVEDHVIAPTNTAGGMHVRYVDEGNILMQIILLHRHFRKIMILEKNLSSMYAA